ncbi:MAG: vWA domain-containing protein [Sandaracinaceae bacterium]
MSVRPGLCGVIVALLLVGCGAKSSLSVPRRAMDGGRDAGPQDSGPPPVDSGPDGGPPADDCIEVPFERPPSDLEVSFVTQISNADVFFLVDVTGSMGQEILAIRTQLRDVIVPGLAAELPEARFSVGHFADFPLPRFNYGDATDELFVMLQRSTTDTSAIQTAVDSLPLQGGRDGPEALTEALYLTASGEGFSRYAALRSCPDGTVGQPCFPALGSRIVIAFTDASTHNGPGGSESYQEGTVEPIPHTYDQTIRALNGIGAKVLGLYSGPVDSSDRDDIEAFARDTGAVRPDGTPIVLDIGQDGELLGPSVVEAVRTLVDEVPIDVDALVEDVNGDSVDATQFVSAIVAERAAPPRGATLADNRFVNVAPGTRLTFRIELVNDILPPTDRPQVFRLRVILLADGSSRLLERTVAVVIPALGGRGCGAI